MSHLLFRNLLIASVLAFLVAACASGNAQDQNDLEEQSFKYSESSTYFPNPERGWHIPLDPVFGTNETAPPLTVEQLKSYRQEGKTLVRKYYLLYAYKNSPIAQSFLDNQLVNDLDVAREAGVKLIPRFNYTWNINYAPGAEDDAPVGRILEHLDQLKPILAANADVISHMEMGFVGRYGEWHDSTNNNVNGDLTLNEHSKQIIAKVLEVLPKERMALLRYPKQLIQLYPNPLGKEEAYSGSDQSRLGLHDDGWLHDETFFGTYPEDQAERQAQRDYQAQVTQYVVMSGEPASLNSSAYGLKVDPVLELATMHWTSLRDEPEGFGEVYDLWRDRGAYEEMSAQLGYRFSLTKAKLLKKVKPGKSLKMSFDVKNSGFAGLHNPRTLEVVLRHTGTGEEYYVTLRDDPRLWLSGETTHLEVEAGLPVDMATGDYAVFINLPDPAPSLYGRPEYSIRFANDDVWEDFSGYNALGGVVTVAKAAKTSDGVETMFQKRTRVPASPAEETTVTLTPQPVVPEAAATPELVEGDVLVDFQDRPTAATRLTGTYGGIDWGENAWQTVSGASGTYLSSQGTSDLSFTLPEGKVLKSFSLLKLNRSGTTNTIVLTSEGNDGFTWTNPAPWWSEHTLGWKSLAATVTVKLTSDSSRGVENLVLDNLVYGNPPPSDVTADFEDLSVGQTLSGNYGGIDWGDTGLWTVGEIDGDRYVYLNSSEATLAANIVFPEGTTLRGIGMRKLEGESYGGDTQVSFIDQEGSVATWALPSDGWNNDYGPDWTSPSGTTTVQVKSDFGAKNVLIGQIRYGLP